MNSSSPTIVFVCGISGVGKSTAIRRLAAKHKDLTVVSAGTLISEARANADRDSLRALSHEELDLNQALLVRGFRLALKSLKTPLLLIDGHAIVDSDTSSSYLVPISVFRSLELRGIVHVEASPQIIAERRAKDGVRKRPDRMTSQLASMQQLSREHASQISTQLGLAFAICDGDQEASLGAIMAKYRHST